MSQSFRHSPSGKSTKSDSYWHSGKGRRTPFSAWPRWPEGLSQVFAALSRFICAARNAHSHENNFYFIWHSHSLWLFGSRLGPQLFTCFFVLNLRLQNAAVCVRGHVRVGPHMPTAMDNYIMVDPLTAKPIECWRKYLRNGRVSEPAKTLRLDAPIHEHKIRFVCISDTHEKLDEILPLIPDGDVLIHAGDFTNYGDVGEVIKFNAEIGKLPHKYKVVIAGNHELGFEDGEEMNERQLAGLNMLGINKAYELLSNCIYLCDREITLFGKRIYGAPWHSMPGYSFYRPRGQKMLHKWNLIPAGVDVLVTHTPPLGHGDFNAWNKMDGILAGDVELLNSVEQRVKPKYHVFGHVHQMHGATTNGATTFINAAICDHKLRSCYDPILFDLPLPAGTSKADFLDASP